MNKVVILIIIAIVVAIIYAFIDNGSDNLAQFEKECKESGKIFKIEKKFNFRNGKYEEKGLCL